jgi:hypothetical protein
MTRAAAGAPPIPAASPKAVRDLRTPTRWLAAVLMPLGPASIAVLRLVMPYSTPDSSTAMVTKISEHPGAEKLVLWMMFIAVVTLVPGVYFAIRLARRRAPVLAAVAALLLIPAFLANAAVGLPDFIGFTATARGVDHATVARIIDLTNNETVVSQLTGIFVAGHLLGMILLACALRRARQIPLPAALILGISQPVHLLAALTGNHPLDLVGWGMTAVGMAFAALAVLRTPDDEWDLPPIPAPAR